MWRLKARRTEDMDDKRLLLLKCETPSAAGESVSRLLLVSHASKGHEQDRHDEERAVHAADDLRRRRRWRPGG